MLTQFALAVGKALLLHAAVLAKAVRTGVLLMQFALAVGKALLHRAAGLTKAMRIYTINYNKVRTLQVNMNELTLAEHKKGSVASLAESFLSGTLLLKKPLLYP